MAKSRDGVRAARAAGPVRIVVITGCSRSGKSRLAASLQPLLRAGSADEVAVVGQDRFWQRSVRVDLPGGKQQMSEEEPQCTNWDRFWQAVDGERAKCAARPGGGSVVVEGFTALHDARLRQLLAAAQEQGRGACLFLDLPREECFARRSAPAGPLNLHPKKRQYCEQLLWPPHERYVAEVLGPLGGAVARIDAALPFGDIVRDAAAALPAAPGAAAAPPQGGAPAEG